MKFMNLFRNERKNSIKFKSKKRNYEDANTLGTYTKNKIYVNENAEGVFDILSKKENLYQTWFRTSWGQEEIEVDSKNLTRVYTAEGNIYEFD